MTGFSKRDVVVDGIRVKVLEAGTGDPLVYFHGAGTSSGFEYLLPLADGRRLIIPIHPGFGESDDDPAIDSVFDYTVHYSALFDELKLPSAVDLMGHSLGGWMASLFAIFNPHRVRRLALVCPAGLRVKEFPTADMFKIRAEDVPSRIVSSPEALERIRAVNLTNDLKIARYREMTSLARIIWDRNYEPKLARWLSHIKASTRIFWGDRDQIIPVEQANLWANRLPSSEVALFRGAGHLLLFEAPEAVMHVKAFFNERESIRKSAPSGS